MPRIVAHVDLVEAEERNIKAWGRSSLSSDVWGRYVDLSGRGGPLGQDQRCKWCNAESIFMSSKCLIFLEAVPYCSFDLI